MKKTSITEIRIEEVIDKVVEAHKDVIAPVMDDEGFLIDAS